MSRRRDSGEIEPAGYGALLAEPKAEVRAAQYRAHRVVNTELLALYWRIGRAILARQQTEGWGTRVVARLADDLRAEFPQMRGFSRTNLDYMRSMAGSNFPASCWEIALGSRHGAAGPPR